MSQRPRVHVLTITYHTRAAHTSLLDASIIYGVGKACEIEEDRFRIEEVRAVISAAVRIRTVGTWRAQYAHNCIPLCHNVLSRVTRPFLPRLYSGRVWERDYRIAGNFHRRKASQISRIDCHSRIYFPRRVFQTSMPLIPAHQEPFSGK